MWRGLLPLTVVLVFGPLSPLVSVGQPPEPKDIPELKVLERWAGKWQSDITQKKSVWFPNGETGKATADMGWVLGGRYLQGKAKAVESSYQGTWLITYDLAHKAYRQWYFDSMGGASELSGKWDETNQTMTWTGQDKVLGFTSKGYHKFLGPDEHEWTSVITDKDGQVLMDQYGKSKRVK